MAKRYTTLEDVAKASGMSRAQVSRALRGDPGVRPETRQRIDEIALKLDYRPNLAARSLVSAQSSIVSVVIGDPNNPFHIQLAQAVDRRLVAAGFDPVTSLRQIETESAEQEADRLLRLRAAGVILIATPRDPEAIGTIAEKLACVYIGSKPIAHPKVTTIAVDDESGIRQAMRHLFELGHRRIAHLAGGQEPSSLDRSRVYSIVMEEKGIEAVVIEGEHNAAFGRRGVDTLFSTECPPTAILASNDFIAMGVLDRLKGLGKSVPQDVSVIGFDDIPDASNELFSLTTLRQDPDVQARAAVMYLQQMLTDTPSITSHVPMPVELIVRRSTAAPRVR
ncbi:LacI family DNA-binding transcriptional regulator [Pseudomonas kurunegalensis]|uniref:LacI family DNA-binding transcriptional regulator n=1 Tax=Pseudomonas kurunegalensis TaxID=485880 RepID=UPI003556C5A3